MSPSLAGLGARISIRWRLVTLALAVVVGMLTAVGHLWRHDLAQHAGFAQATQQFDQAARWRDLHAAYGDYRYRLIVQLSDAAQNRPDWQAQTRVQLELAQVRLNERLDRLGSAPAAPSIRQDLEALAGIPAAALQSLGRGEQAASQSLGAELRTRLDALDGSIGRQVDEAQRRVGDTASWSGRTLLADSADLTLLGGMISLTVLLCALLIRSVVRPLESLVQATDGLTRGELETPLPQARKDEIGAIARALHRFREGAKRTDFLAYHDPLTGLPNRARLQEVLGAELARTPGQESALVVLYCGFDQLTTINETLGPAAGDEYLRIVSRRLRACAPDSAQLFHMGGSQFVVLPAALANDSRLIANADRLGRSLVGDMSRPFTLQDQEIEMAVNLGVATFPQDGANYDELIGNAHAALTHARRRGHNHFQFYTRQLTDRARSRLALASQLKHAVEAGEFTVHYQPVLDVETQEIISAEALMRWRHPQRGLVMPGEFIEVAEETGVITAMGEWCLAQACLDSRAWRQAGFARLKLAVNLSARQLNEPGLVDTIEQTLQYTGLAPNELELEITESAVMQNPDRCVRVLRHLKSIGITLSVDDFGTGYSSLAYLQRFPLDKIKIDRSFVARLNRRRKDELIIAATAGLAADLGLQVVAEGVETVEQMQTLQQLGCRYMQGFLFSRAIPTDDFVRWARSSERQVLPRPAVK